VFSAVYGIAAGLSSGTRVHRIAVRRTTDSHEMLFSGLSLACETFQRARTGVGRSSHLRTIWPNWRSVRQSVPLASCFFPRLARVINGLRGIPSGAQSASMKTGKADRFAEIAQDVQGSGGQEPFRLGRRDRAISADADPDANRQSARWGWAKGGTFRRPCEATKGARLR
jgi:hypothetical protein